MLQPAAVPRARGAVGAILLLSATLLVAACGTAASTGDGVVSLRDPSATPGPSASPAASMDPEDAMEAFAACMREHGVDMEFATIGDGETGTVDVGGGVTGEGPAIGGEAQPGSGPVDADALAAADEACRDLLPADGFGDPGATMDPAVADQMLEFARCMREHGIDFPDPVFEGGAVSITLGGDGEGGIDPTSEAFADAQAACGEAMPGGAPFVVGPAPAGTEP